jgi:predicted porin
MNRKLLATAVASAIAPMAAQAVDVSVSGQVNRAIRFADNGVNSDVQHIDGSASGSRFRITADGELMDGVQAGAVVEVGWTVNGGGALDVDVADAAKPKDVDFRKSSLHFSGDFGKVTMGWNAPAGNGIEWTSHSGAWAGTEYSADTNSGIHVRASDGTDQGSVFSFLPSVNIGRQNTLRYDSPSIGPIGVSVSLQKNGEDGQTWSFGGSLAQDFGGSSVSGGVFVMEDKFAIAGGILFSQGTSVNAVWGNNDTGTTDYETMYLNVSHTWGDTSVGLGYRTADDGDTSKGAKEAQAIGLGVSQSLGSGVIVYAGFNNYSFDMTGYDLEDINAFHIGSRVQFN